MPFSDRVGFVAIAAALETTGQFAVILEGRNPPEIASAGGLYPRAWILPRGFREESRVDPEQPTRTVLYRISLTIRPDPGSPVEPELERLGDLVQNALGGNGLGGALPSLSAVAEGLYSDDDVAPERSLILSGSFAYLVSGFSGRDETDP
jgi:hypothetical protein